MNTTTTARTVCSQCRSALRRRLRAAAAAAPSLPQQPTGIRHETRRGLSSSSTPAPSPREILARPTWSVRSLLPSQPSSSTGTSSPPPPSSSSPPTTPEVEAEEEEITPATLRHLLRLSALPPPADAGEEARLLGTLRAQLGFVRAVRAVPTADVRPLRAIRDETAAGVAADQTVRLADLAGALAREDIVGHGRRPRRRRGPARNAQEEKEAAEQQQKQQQVQTQISGVEDWDVLAGAGMTAGRYFVVRSGGNAGEPPVTGEAVG